MTSLRAKARVAGILYIVASLVGLVRLIYIPTVLIVRGDATATANNIAAHQSLFRLGILSEPIAATLWLFVPLALYRLLKDVDHGLAVVMVILGSLMQVPLFLLNSLNDAAALLLIRGADFLSVVDKRQREALAMLFLNLHHHINLVNAIFWGLWLLPLGLLVYRSRFLPRFLGVWLMIGCFALLTFSVTGILLPGQEEKVFNYCQPLTFGEVVIMFWLAIAGAKEPAAAA